MPMHKNIYVNFFRIMENVQNGTRVLLVSGPGNTLSLPELHYTNPQESVPHTLQVLNIEYTPPSMTGYLNVKLNLKEAFMLRVSHATSDSESDVISKLNKAYAKFAGTQETLMQLTSEDTINITVGDGILFTNSELFLRKGYESLMAIQEVTLPDVPFTCFHAGVGDKAVSEWADLRTGKFYSEEVRGNYTTPKLPTIKLLPNQVYFGFQPLPGQAETFQFPLQNYSPLLPSLLTSQTLARNMTQQFQKSRLAKHYNFNMTVSLCPETRAFTVMENTFKKILVKSWIQIHAQAPPIARTPQQWHEKLGILPPTMIVPPVHRFLPVYVSPFTLHMSSGIGNTALLQDFTERVIALFDIHNGLSSLLFAPKNVLNSRYALNDIPLEMKDSQGTKIPGRLNVHVAIT